MSSPLVERPLDERPLDERRLDDWRLEDWQRRTIVYAVVFGVIYGVLSLSSAPDYASALAGTEPSFGGTVVGLFYVMTRLLSIVFAPIGLLAVLLASVGSWLVRRFAPSLRDDG